MLSEDFIGDGDVLCGYDSQFCFQLSNNFLLSCREFPGEELGLRVTAFPGNICEVGVWCVCDCY